LFFARHLDYFIMTRQLASIYQDLVPSSQFIVTRQLRPSIGTVKKHVTATQTAPN
jgi:hypothetical protein